MVFLLAATVIGLPYAVKKAVDWAFVQQVAAFEGHKAARRLASARLVRGHWWRVASITFVLLVLLAITGPFFGVLVIFVTWMPHSPRSTFAALLFAFVLLFVSAALTLLYLDLAVRRDSQEATPGMLPAA